MSNQKTQNKITNEQKINGIKFHLGTQRVIKVGKEDFFATLELQSFNVVRANKSLKTHFGLEIKNVGVTNEGKLSVHIAPLE
jgi:hypothetical protein